MTFQAYLDTIKAETGKTPEDFRVMAEEKGLLTDGVKAGPIIAWLKEDYGLGQGHAMAIVQTLRDVTQPKLSAEERLAQRFSGAKARWRAPFDILVAQLKTFGPGVTVAPTDTYISLLREGRKFAIVELTAARMDLGIKLKGVEPFGRLESAEGWNSMVTHRLRITDAAQIDNEALTWLRRAYDAA